MTLDQLHAVLRREIERGTPQAIELLLPGESLVIPATPTAVINELIVRDAQDVELVRMSATYLVDHDFLYALTVEIK